MYLLGSYIQQHVGSWIFLPLGESLKPMNKIIVDKKFDTVVLDTDHDTKEKIKFWQSAMSTTLCSAL